jgi:uncharacterized protein (TIGR03435 family)
VHILRRVEEISPLRESTSKERKISRRKGRFSATRASMADLVKFTRSIAPEPVVDETGLDGVYDWIMEWDPSGSGNAWLQAFQDLGLELVKGERSVEQLVISRAAAKPSVSSDE